MSTIFLSHSSQDRRQAEQLKERLQERGYRSIFLDVDPQSGITAGARWERELYQRLSACSVVIAMCSQASKASRWCFAEITYARSHGKRIVPVTIESCDVEPLLTDVQIVDLTDASNYERLWRGLRDAGLDPNDDFGWDPSRPPYPGLNRFDESDAAVYFGRSAEIDQLTDLLGRMRRHGPARFAITLGSSGCGKSSLVRAGLVPRLLKDTERWVVVPTFRPMDASISELARAIASAFARFARPIDWQDLRDQLSHAAAPESRAAAAAALADATRSLTLAADRREAATVFIIDQLEEALDRVGGADVEALLWLVAGASQTLGGSVLFLATLRSDYLGTLQQHPAFTGLDFETFPVGPLPSSRLPEVIEGPATRAGLRLEPGLVGRLVQDTGNNDALPLLAFTLREMYEECRSDGQLTLAAYERLGGLAGAVAKRASGVVGEHLSGSIEDALHHSFLSMAKIGEEGQVIRRSARIADFPSEAHELLDRLVDHRLLVTRGEGEERTVEVAHEALFRVWPKLAEWMRDGREFLLWRRRLQTYIEEWQSGSGALIDGAALAQAADWRVRQASALGAVEQQFIDASARAERSRRRKRQFVVATVMVTVATLSAAALWQSFQLREQAAAVRDNAAVMIAQQQHRDGNSFLGILLLKEVDERRLQPFANRAATELWTNARVPIALLPAPSRVEALAFSPDGRRVAIGSQNGSVRLRTSDGRNGSVVLPGSLGYTAGTTAVFSSEGFAVRHLEFSPDGSRFLAVTDDHTVRVWLAEATGEPVVLPHRVQIISGSFSADGRSILTVSQDGHARVWSSTRSQEPAVLPLFEEESNALRNELRAAFSPDGRFVVTNFDDPHNSPATVRIWRVEGNAPMPITLRGPTTRVRSVAFSPNGLQVAAGTQNGTIWIWNANGTGEPRVLHGRDQCYVFDLQFSPSGEDLVAHCRQVGGGSAVHLWTGGDNAVPRLLESEGLPQGTRFTRDGRYIVVNSSDKLRIEPVRGDGDRIALPKRGPSFDADVTADGATIGLVSDGGVEVWRRDAERNVLPTASENAAALGEATTACLSAYERRIWLSEHTGDAAQRGYAACERRYGREPIER